ncbi:MAG: hypothetical protein KDK64_04500 [Chlamydiia bacterium]|nr:hypothetical protein [Chlamydiia bacterium]
MKQLIGIITGAGFLLMTIPYAHLSLENRNDSYLRYREEYTHNLKNSLIQRYRKLSYEAPKEVPRQENEQKEEKWNCSH